MLIGQLGVDYLAKYRATEEQQNGLLFQILLLLNK